MGIASTGPTAISSTLDATKDVVGHSVTITFDHYNLTITI